MSRLWQPSVWGKWWLCRWSLILYWEYDCCHCTPRQWHHHRLHRICQSHSHLDPHTSSVRLNLHYWRTCHRNRVCQGPYQWCFERTHCEMPSLDLDWWHTHSVWVTWLTQLDQADCVDHPLGKMLLSSNLSKILMIDCKSHSLLTASHWVSASACLHPQSEDCDDCVDYDMLSFLSESLSDSCESLGTIGLWSCCSILIWPLCFHLLISEVIQNLRATCECSTQLVSKQASHCVQMSIHARNFPTFC